MINFLLYLKKINYKCYILIILIIAFRIATPNVKKYFFYDNNIEDKLASIVDKECNFQRAIGDLISIKYLDTQGWSLKGKNGNSYYEGVYLFRIQGTDKVLDIKVFWLKESVYNIKEISVNKWGFLNDPKVWPSDSNNKEKDHIYLSSYINELIDCGFHLTILLLLMTILYKYPKKLSMFLIAEKGFWHDTLFLICMCNFFYFFYKSLYVIAFTVL